MPSASPHTYRELIVARARLIGFEHVGIARADLPLETEHDRYVRFVEAGMHGSMSYLGENVEARRRLDGPSILEGAKSVICVAKPYGRSAESEASDPPTARLIARYARGRDYHNHLRRKLRQLARYIRTLDTDARARPLSDVEPILERAWATRAGLGFVGKNGLVIVPGTGSMVLLGEVVTNLELEADAPMTERCGSCTRCLDACPTNAFEAPFVLDPRKCIAYLTIESQEVAPPELQSAIGEHLFGCDDCQSVCPFNRARAPAADKTEPYLPLPIWSETSLAELAGLDEAAFEKLSTGTPVKRAGRRGLARNAVVVAENRLGRPSTDDRAALAETDEAKAALRAGAESSDALVADLARRALSKFST